ncbi:Reticulon [Dillenia turbinata]|uniref:Reticulon-like protein n=1 Tax=Dillenia turbinata TaxID=194707 RepID=A0AAN8Z0M1_9MAGN
MDGRRFSLHQSLGGGLVADVLLWRKLRASVMLLIGATSMWFLFERAGYNFLPLPPIPDLGTSEESVAKIIEPLRTHINHALSVAREIAVGGNVLLFIQVAFCLWLISYIGSFLNFLTLMYIGVLLSLSLPPVYEKYQDLIEGQLTKGHQIIREKYRNIDENILRKLPLNKVKKFQ